MILIILPVHNEEKNVVAVAKDILAFCQEEFEKDFLILFINDSSTDDTFNAVKNSNLPNTAIFNNTFDQGKGSALKTGFVIANHVYNLDSEDVIIFMDGDGQIEPKEIKTFLNIMRMYGSDVVIGNKRHKFSSSQYGIKRKILSIGYNLLVRTLFGVSYQDTQCGIKIFKKSSLDLVINKVTSKKYAFDLELIVAINSLGLRIVDAPVAIKKQLNLGSATIKNVISTFIETINIWIRKKNGIYKEGD